MKRIGILGGTFDPIHNGHVEIAKFVYQELKLDEVWIMPNNKSPFKTDKVVSANHHRLAMAKLATADYEYLKVTDFEMNKSEVSYTYDTLKELTAVHNDKEFYFIIGADQAVLLNKWYKIQELKELVNFVVLKRDNLEIKDEGLIYLDNQLYNISATSEKQTGFHNVNPKVKDYIERNQLYDQ